MKLKRTGDTEAFQDKAARQTKSFLNHYLSFKALTWLFLNVSVQVCVFVRRIPSRMGTAATTQQHKVKTMRLVTSGKSGGLMGT